MLVLGSVVILAISGTNWDKEEISLAKADEVTRLLKKSELLSLTGPTAYPVGTWVYFATFSLDMVDCMSNCPA